MDRRREALGRNRQSPSTRNTVPAFIVGIVAIAAAGWWAFSYFTEPERVFGSRELNCSATEITWVAQGRTTVISGCGRSIDAVCNDKQCLRKE